VFSRYIKCASRSIDDGKEIYPSPAKDDLDVVPYLEGAYVHVPIEINEGTGKITVSSDLKPSESKPVESKPPTSDAFTEIKILRSNKAVGEHTTINMAKGTLARICSNWQQCMVTTKLTKRAPNR
jgi:hypothetical protein